MKRQSHRGVGAFFAGNYLATSDFLPIFAIDLIMS